jgi:hypothetical protein
MHEKSSTIILGEPFSLIELGRSVESQQLPGFHLASKYRAMEKTAGTKPRGAAAAQESHGGQPEARTDVAIALTRW